MEAGLDSIISGNNGARNQQVPGRGAVKGRGPGRGRGALNSSASSGGLGALQAIRDGTLQGGPAVSKPSRGSTTNHSSTARGKNLRQTSQPEGFDQHEHLTTQAGNGRPNPFLNSSTTSHAQPNPRSISPQNPPAQGVFGQTSQSTTFGGKGFRGRSTSPTSVPGQFRANGHLSQTFNTTSQSSSTPTSRTSTPKPQSFGKPQSQNFMARVQERYQSVSGNPTPFG